MSCLFRPMASRFPIPFRWLMSYFECRIFFFFCFSFFLRSVVVLIDCQHMQTKTPCPIFLLEINRVNHRHRIRNNNVQIHFQLPSIVQTNVKCIVKLSLSDQSAIACARLFRYFICIHVPPSFQHFYIAFLLSLADACFFFRD